MVLADRLRNAPTAWQELLESWSWWDPGIVEILGGIGVLEVSVQAGRQSLRS